LPFRQFYQSLAVADDLLHHRECEMQSPIEIDLAAFGSALARPVALPILRRRGCGKTTRRAKFRLTRRANHSYKFARLTRQEGRIAIVTNADGMRWTRQRRARRGVRRAGWQKTCERSNGARTNGDCGVRQNRVVLASVADVKPAEVLQTQPGSANP
jgi:hypothetical protein